MNEIHLLLYLNSINLSYRIVPQLVIFHPHFRRNKMKIKGLIIAAIFIKIITAQSFTFETGDTKAYIELDSLVVFDATITNVSLDTIIVAIVRTVNDLPENWLSRMCLDGLCYPPIIDSIATNYDFGSSPVEPDSCRHFTLYIDANTNEGTGTVQLVILDVDSTVYSDTVNYVVTTYPAGYSGPVWHVSTTGNDTTGDGSAENPFATIQHGINVASEGDTVLVYEGTYVENINYNGKNIMVGSLYITTSDTFYISSTIIDGDSSGSVVSFISGEDENSVLTGFTIMRGFAAYGDTLLVGGGGIRCIHSSPTIENNIITQNYCDWYVDGAGIFCSYSDAQILGNTISKNYGAYAGAGICIRDSSDVLVLDNVIRSNETMSGYGVAEGAGIFVGVGSEPLIEGNTIKWNVMDFGDGGGICVWGESSPRIFRNVIAGNEGEGIVCMYDTEAQIVNNTIVANLCGIRTDGGAHPIVVNSIVWGNENEEIVVDSSYGSSDITVVYSDVEGGWAGTGNIDADPHFVDSTDFHLQEGSPCIDAGTAFFVWMGDTVVDFSPDEYVGFAPDMGAYEYGAVGFTHDLLLTPHQFALYQNYPNPFNPLTTIRYNLPEQSYVTVVIYDLIGREVKELVSGELVSGYHKAVWDGTDSFGKPVGAGVYLYQIRAKDFIQTKKMVLLK